MAEKITTFKEAPWEFLSNFWPVTLMMPTGLPPARTLEAAFAAAKTQVIEEKVAILSAETPGRAKRLGRKATVRGDWEQIRVEVMLGLLRRKFAPGTELAAMLIATGERVIEEGNTWGDTFWGVDLATGEGQNTLGRLLMQVRAELR